LNTIASAGTNWLAFAMTLAVSFVLTPHLITSLGKPRYDIWCVVESILAYLTLLDLGVAACLVRYTARYSAQKEFEALNRMASSCLALFLAAGGVALVLGGVAVFLLEPRLQAKLPGEQDLLPFMLLMLANMAMTLPLSVFPSLLDGQECFVTKSLIRIGTLALRTVGIVWVLNHSVGLVPLAVVFTLCNLLEHGLMMVAARRAIPALRFSASRLDRESLRQVRTYSIDAFLAMLAGRITLQTGAIVIGLVLVAGQVTFFVTAARLIDYAKTLLRQITTTLTPGIAAREARGDWTGIRMLFLTATRWLAYASMLIHAGLILFGKPFLHRWVGPEFLPGSYPALVILSLTLTLGVLQSVASRVLYGLGRLRLFAWLALAEGLINLVLLFLLIHTYGVVGVAWAIAIPNILFCLVIITHVCRMLGISLGEYLRTLLRPGMLVLVPVGIWVLLGEAEPTWPAIVGQGFLGVIPYALLVGVVEIGLPRLALRRKVAPQGDPRVFIT
jgi:O-antigen/teichoic acid export membrane protein